MQSAATTRSRESTMARRGRRYPLLALSHRCRPALRPDLVQLLPQPGAGRVRHVRGFGQRAIELELLDLALGKRQQQLARSTDAQWQGPPELDEWAQFMASFHRRDADASVVLADIEVNALAQLVPKPSHGLVGYGAQVERIRRGFAPVQQARAERIPPVLGAADDPECCQLVQESVGRRLGHAERRTHVAERHRLTGPPEAVDQVAGLLEDGQLSLLLSQPDGALEAKG